MKLTKALLSVALMAASYASLAQTSRFSNVLQAAEALGFDVSQVRADMRRGLVEVDANTQVFLPKGSVDTVVTYTESNQGTPDLEVKRRVGKSWQNVGPAVLPEFGRGASTEKYRLEYYNVPEVLLRNVRTGQAFVYSAGGRFVPISGKPPAANVLASLPTHRGTVIAGSVTCWAKSPAKPACQLNASGDALSKVFGEAGQEVGQTFFANEVQAAQLLGMSATLAADAARTGCAYGRDAEVRVEKTRLDEDEGGYIGYVKLVSVDSPGPLVRLPASQQREQGYQCR